MKFTILLLLTVLLIGCEPVNFGNYNIFTGEYYEKA